MAAEGDDHLRAHAHDLGPEEGHAALQLARLGVAVVRRAALHDVGDVDLVAAHAHAALDDRGELLPRPPDEGQPLAVLVSARPLADEHQLRLRVARAEDDLRAAGGQLAATAVAEHAGHARQVGRLRERGHQRGVRLLRRAPAPARRAAVLARLRSPSCGAGLGARRALPTRLSLRLSCAPRRLGAERAGDAPRLFNAARACGRGSFLWRRTRNWGCDIRRRTRRGGWGRRAGAARGCRGRRRGWGRRAGGARGCGGRILNVGLPGPLRVGLSLPQARLRRRRGGLCRAGPSAEQLGGQRRRGRRRRVRDPEPLPPAQLFAQLAAEPLQGLQRGHLRIERGIKGDRRHNARRLNRRRFNRRGLGGRGARLGLWGWRELWEFGQGRRRRRAEVDPARPVQLSEQQLAERPHLPVRRRHRGASRLSGGG